MRFGMMEHTQFVVPSELERYADTRESQAVIPELVYMLVQASVSDLTECRIPYGDAINQPGWDGLVETESGFRQFVPRRRSYWEIGVGRDPQSKATADFKKRTESMSPDERKAAAFVFVTPRSSASGGWNQSKTDTWVQERDSSGWGEVRIIDGIKLADWLLEFPAIGKWLFKRMSLVKTTAGFTTPAEHWDNLRQLTQGDDPPLPPKVFLVGRDRACVELRRLFCSEIKQLGLAIESAQDAEDFVAAFLASLDSETQRLFNNKCLFVKDADTWVSMVTLKTEHVLVAHQQLDLESSGEQLYLAAKKNRHNVIIPVSGVGGRGSETIIPLRSPSAASLEATLKESGYSHERAHQLAGAGALSLAALKRHLRGFGEPPYATWGSARVLAQAELFGRWSGSNPADKAAMEIVLGKTYGEWIEIVRPETLRSDTPLIQRNENWKIISRGEAWSALGPRLCNEDLDCFQKAAVAVLGERDPKFDLPVEERFAASIRGKVLQYSSSLRKGIAETLALLGSRPNALSSCTQGKAELAATLTVRELLKEADWGKWASLDRHLPMLAEAAPSEFLNCVETALLHPNDSPFHEVFAQEKAGIMGGNYMSGLLWALETLAWHPDYLMRVTIVLGELAAIDPGGNWVNRPANSLVTIFLPWYPQTCAPIPKRKAAVEALLREQPVVGWQLLLALLPVMRGATSGSNKPSWRDFIPAEWTEGVTNREYREQVTVYSNLAVDVAAADSLRLAKLIDRLPDLPELAYSRVLEHLASATIASMLESARLPLWEALVDLAAKHRQFSDAQWAMPSDAVAKIEEAAVKLAPKSASLVHRRLFSDRDLDLYEEKGNWEVQAKKLEERRQKAIREILKEQQLSGILDFVQQVASPEKVGLAIGCIEDVSADTVLLPDYLDRTDKSLLAFIGGFVWGSLQTKSWPWVDEVVTDAWSILQKVKFFTLLPFVHDAWQRAEKLLGEDSSYYWKSVNVNPWGPQEHLLEAVEKLLWHHRPRAVVACLYRLLHEKVAFSPDLAVRVLMESLTSEERVGISEQHEILDIIKWLQENPPTNTDELFQVEWAYLPLFDNHMGASPKLLEQRLAGDPDFFCMVIRTVFRSKNVERPVKEPTEQEKNIATNAYRLLHDWRTPPGTLADGTFSEDALNSWLDVVKVACKDSGHLEMALAQVGEVLIHTPPDPDGLWIHRSVAEVLNAKDAEDMRSGYQMGEYNARGVHCVDPSGKPERDLAAEYRERADALEKCGYPRFATTLRGLAEEYNLEAKRISSRDMSED